MTVFRYDCGCVDKECYLTPEGYIRGSAIVTRTGVFTYMNPDGTIRKELRLPEDVLNQDSLDTMKMIPITNGHPSVRLVDAKNSKDFVIGFTGDSISNQGDYIKSNFVITHEDGVKAVRDQGRKQLSLGYTVDLLPEKGTYEGQHYDFVQKNIRYNHLAIVDNARAGSEARINLDQNDAFEIQGESKMTKRKIKLDAMEVYVEPEVADYIESSQEREKNHAEEIDRLERDARNLREEKDRVEEELKRIEAELERVRGENDRVTAERDSMKYKVSKTDSVDHNKAVNARVKLYMTANTYLDRNKLSRLDEMSDIQIKKEIINSCKKSINLDGKSDVYIESMFDVVMADQSNKVNVSNVKPSNTTHMDGDYDPVKSRELMKKRHQEAHKQNKTPQKV